MNIITNNTKANVEQLLKPMGFPNKCNWDAECRQVHGEVMYEAIQLEELLYWNKRDPVQLNWFSDAIETVGSGFKSAGSGLATVGSGISNVWSQGVQKTGLDVAMEEAGISKEFQNASEKAKATLENVKEKSAEIGTKVKDAVEQEAEYMWTDLLEGLGINRDRYFRAWRENLATQAALHVGGVRYTSLTPDDSKTPTKSSNHDGKVWLELTRIRPIIDILNNELLIDKPRDSGIRGIPFFKGLQVPSFGSKNIKTWKLSCPEGHILVPKLNAGHVKDPDGYYEEGGKFYNISNECGTSYKANDAPRSFLGKGGKAAIDGLKTVADFAGLTTLVFSDGTKQCCRQHKMCLLGYSEAIEDVWAQGKREINGTVCEQEYWECLGACSLMGSMQNEIAEVFGLPDTLKGGCPSESDISESGGTEKLWTDSVGKGARFLAKRQGKRYIRNKIAEKIYGKAKLREFKQYKKLKKAGKSTKHISKAAIKAGKSAQFLKKGMSVIPKLVKEVGVAPALAFSSFDMTKDLPVHENWMCIPDPLELEPVPEDKDCIGNWVDSSECSREGRKTQSWIISQEQQGDGFECRNEEGNILTSSSAKTETCTYIPPVDCKGVWSPWTSCSMIGLQNRTFTITTQPERGGQPCPGLPGSNLHTRSQLRGCTPPPPPKLKVIQSQWSKALCLGSKNVLLTDRGTIQLRDLKVGDRVLTKDGKWSIVFYIRNHGFTPVPHLRLRFSDGATVILTTGHLLYDETDNLVRADEVSVGDVVSGGETIVKIEHMVDIPLTPCVVEGVIIIEGKSISCWSQNVENARKMDACCRQVQDAMDQGIPIDVISKMTHNIYEKFHASGKDLSKGTKQWKAAVAETTQEKDQFLSNTEVLLKNTIAV